LYGTLPGGYSQCFALLQNCLGKATVTRWINFVEATWQHRNAGPANGNGRAMCDAVDADC
jgi:hypothetical protein